MRRRSRTCTNHQEIATNNHQLMPMPLYYSKLSRWRQPPRVTRKLQPQRSPSATRCNHSSKCSRNHSQSHFDDESTEKMSGRGLVQLTSKYGWSKFPRRWPRADQQVFIESQKNRASIPLHWAHCEMTGLTSTMWPNSQGRVWSLGCGHMSLWFKLSSPIPTANS
jgi:hypothetical protein